MGAVLVTGGMLLLVYALIKAPDHGWGTARTIGELVAAAVVLAAFLLNEARSRTRWCRSRSSASRGSRPPTRRS